MRPFIGLDEALDEALDLNEPSARRLRHAATETNNENPTGCRAVETTIKKMEKERIKTSMFGPFFTMMRHDKTMNREKMVIERQSILK